MAKQLVSDELWPASSRSCRPRSLARFRFAGRRPIDHCFSSFRNTPEGVASKAKYGDKVRDLILPRLFRLGGVRLVPSQERPGKSLRIFCQRVSLSC